MQWQAARTALLLALVASVVPRLVTSQAVSTRTEESTLVVYSYRQSDPEALGNFQYFLDNVMSPRDPARYIIVVDHNSPQQHGHMSLAGLPRLPTNAQYLSIRDCYELGHVGKVLLGLSSKHVSTEQYDFFVWLDSSVRRSVFPTPDAQGDHAAPWHTQLTSRISSSTKLIGASITCEAATPQQPGEMLVPHVEATIMATDRKGLDVLQKAKCFDCYSTMHEAKMKGEIAASSAILKANYNLDAFLPPYQNVNWQDKRAWPCTGTHMPQQHKDPGSAAGLLTNIVESFRTGSKATGMESATQRDAQTDIRVLPAADKGTVHVDPDARIQDNLVEELLEAEEKSEVSDSTHHVPHTRGTVLQIEVTCEVLEQEPVEREEEEMQLQAADLASQVAEADAAQGVDLVFYGDSILDGFNSETGGHTNVFKDVFGDYTALIQAIGGDQTAHLWWRVLNGGAFEKHQPKLSVIMIGGNDLEDVATCAVGESVITAAVPQTVSRIESIVQHLHQVNPDTPILLLGMVAMADQEEPNAEGVFPWPNKFTAATEMLNEQLDQVAIRLDDVHYHDCHHVLLADRGIEEAIVPDGIHPSPPGMQLLAECIAIAVHRLARPAGK